MNKILLIKTSALGDIIHTYPVVDYLREKFPLSQIDWVVEAPFVQLVESHPGIDHVICIATKAWRKAFFNPVTWRSIHLFRKHLRKENYDVVFDLQGNVKSGLVVSQTKSRSKVGFANNSIAEWPNLLFTNHKISPSEKGNIRHEYLSLVASYFNDPMPNANKKVKLKVTEEQQRILTSLIQKCSFFQKPIVMVCPGSAWPNKQLSKETLLAFLILLQNDLDCCFLFLWGSIPEKIIADDLFSMFTDRALVMDKMELPVLQNLMDASDLVIAMDSLPLHLAGTTSTPSFSVFGASSAKKYKPLGENHFAFQGNCPYGRTFDKRCPILRTCSTGACIQDLKAKEIFSSFQQWWNEKNDWMPDV